MNYLILHGTLGNPTSNWFPWLAGELVKQGHTTLCPQLPSPQGQTPQNWLRVIGESVKQLETEGGDIAIVAHSRSPLSVCQYLQTRTTPIKLCVFVAGFAKHLPDVPEPYPTLNNPFDNMGANWSKVQSACEKFICLAGDNDPYVPLAIAHDFATKLSAEFIIVPNGGHLGSNFTQLPLLLPLLSKTE